MNVKHRDTEITLSVFKSNVLASYPQFFVSGMRVSSLFHGPILEIVQSKKVGRSCGYVQLKDVGQSQRLSSKKKLSSPTSSYSPHVRGDAIECLASLTPPHSRSKLAQKDIIVIYRRQLKVEPPSKFFFFILSAWFDQ